MYQDKAPSPASSSDSDPKAKLKMKITQMLEQRRGGNKMASPASVSTSAPSKDALPIDESDTDIAKMEDVDHADGDDVCVVDDRRRCTPRRYQCVIEFLEWRVGPKSKESPTFDQTLLRPLLDVNVRKDR